MTGADSRLLHRIQNPDAGGYDKRGKWKGWGGPSRTSTSFIIDPATVIKKQVPGTSTKRKADGEGDLEGLRPAKTLKQTEEAEPRVLRITKAHCKFFCKSFPNACFERECGMSEAILALRPGFCKMCYSEVSGQLKSAIDHFTSSVGTSQLKIVEAERKKKLKAAVEGCMSQKLAVPDTN